MAPLARLTQPAAHQLRFAEVVAFRGDFGPGERANPKGIAYDSRLDRVIVSVSPNVQPQGRIQLLTALDRGGGRSPFAPGYRPFREVEAMIAVVPGSGPPVGAGFAAGDLFVGRGPGGEISRLSAGGLLRADLFADTGLADGLWGGLTFDVGGAFGGRLIAVSTNGAVVSVASNGTVTPVANLNRRTEGIAVAPPGFGPVARQIVVGVEGYSDSDPESGKVYAIDAAGSVTLLADIGYCAEDLQFVPTGGATYYQCELCFDRDRENRVFSASAPQFLGRAGQLIVVAEMTGELWAIAWDGTGYTLSLAGRVPGRWSSEGLSVQGTELEGGCFAARRATLPAWSTWNLVPGSGRTDAPPAAATDASQNLQLLVKGRTDRRVYRNGMFGATRQWTGWQEMPPGGFTTPVAPTLARHDTTVYAFAVADDNTVWHKAVFIGTGGLQPGPWIEVPGGGSTNASVAAAVSNGRLVLAMKRLDGRLALNELAPGGRGRWTGWTAVPESPVTQLPPTVAGFQEELHLFAVEAGSGRILVAARGTEGDWSAWAELPGAGRVAQPLAAALRSGQLHVFANGMDLLPYTNVDSATGTWSGWTAIPGGTTDRGLGASTIGTTTYLFAIGIDDRQIYYRWTL